MRAHPVANRMHRKMSSLASASLDALPFSHFVTEYLPVDESKRRESRTVRNAIYSRIDPVPLTNPRLVAVSPSALELLQIPAKECEREDANEYFSGNKTLPGSDNVAHCYCGHQFGLFSGQLGDGTAVTVGWVQAPEHVHLGVNQRNGRGHSHGHGHVDPSKLHKSVFPFPVGYGLQHTEFQFKGSGPTPYSRGSDGRKVFRSSLREFLCCEAMHYLGVPTVRSGSLVISDDKVIRDKFSTGNIQEEYCAVVSRLTPTFFRFGSFEIAKGTDVLTGRSGSNPGNIALLKKLALFAAHAYFPHVVEKVQKQLIRDAKNDALDAKYIEKNPVTKKVNQDKLFVIGESAEITPYVSKLIYGMIVDMAQTTARLVASWQCLGFTHGVLNTDNMSVLGVFLDAGPYGFLETYDTEYLSNSNDPDGRYSFQRQPAICQWNCIQVGKALAPLLGTTKEEQDKWAEAVNHYAVEYHLAYNSGVYKKLGLGYVPYLELLDFAPLSASPTSFTAQERSPLAFVSQWSQPEPSWGKPLVGVRTMDKAGTPVNSEGPMDASSPNAASSTTDQEEAPSSPALMGFHENADFEKVVDGFFETLTYTGGDFTNSFRVLLSLSLADCVPSSEERDDSPVLQQLLDQCCSLVRLQYILRPEHTLEQLLSTKEKLQADTRYKAAIPEVDAAIRKYKLYEELQRMNDDEKKAKDKEKWKTWLAMYKQTLFQQLPDYLQEYLINQKSRQSDGASTPTQQGAGQDATAEPVALSLAEQVIAYDMARLHMMLSHNPLFVPRNWLLEMMIAQELSWHETGAHRKPVYLSMPDASASTASTDSTAATGAFGSSNISEATSTGTPSVLEQSVPYILNPYKLENWSAIVEYLRKETRQSTHARSGGKSTSVLNGDVSDVKQWLRQVHDLVTYPEVRPTVHEDIIEICMRRPGGLEMSLGREPPGQDIQPAIMAEIEKGNINFTSNTPPWAQLFKLTCSS